MKHYETTDNLEGIKCFIYMPCYGTVEAMIVSDYYHESRKRDLVEVATTQGLFSMEIHKPIVLRKLNDQDPVFYAG